MADPGPGLIEPGYSVEEALSKLHADFSEIAGSLGLRPPGLSPSGYVMLELVRHPDRQQERNFPHRFLAAMKLRPAGENRRAVEPRRRFGPADEENRFTTCLAVLARKNDIAAIPAKIRALDPSSQAAREMTCLESASLEPPESRLFLEPGDRVADGTAELFEAVLLSFPGRKTLFPIDAFTGLAEKNGFQVIRAKKNDATGYLHVLMSGPREGLINLAEFSMTWLIKRPGEKI